MAHLRGLPGEVFCLPQLQGAPEGTCGQRFTAVVLCASRVTLTPHLKVSHFWIGTSETLRYIVWLGIHAKLDGDSSVSLSPKISSLLEHEQNWLTLRVSQGDHRLGDQSKGPQLYLSGSNGSYVLTHIHEEHTL